MKKTKKKVLLLGTGYTLTRFINKYSNEYSLIALKRGNLNLNSDVNTKNILIEKCDLLTSDISRILTKYQPNYIVDSTPPNRSENPTKITERIINGIGNYSGTINGFIYLSTTGVYGVTDGSIVTEQTPPNPFTPFGKARLQVEELYSSFAKKLNIPLCRLRLSAIYGEDRGLHQALKAGRYKPVKGKWSNRIFVEDICITINKLLSTDQSLWPQIINLADDKPTKSEEITAIICSELGIPYPGETTIEELKARGAFTMLSNQRIDNSLLKKFLDAKLIKPDFSFLFKDLKT